MGIHVHMAEDWSDQKDNKREYSMSVVERLHGGRRLGPKTMADPLRARQDRAKWPAGQDGNLAVHNPQSNMNNAVGVAP